LDATQWWPQQRDEPSATAAARQFSETRASRALSVYPAGERVLVFGDREKLQVLKREVYEWSSEYTLEGVRVVFDRVNNPYKTHDSQYAEAVTLGVGHVLRFCSSHPIDSERHGERAQPNKRTVPADTDRSPGLEEAVRVMDANKDSDTDC
jgi:hypothetical protein